MNSEMRKPKYSNTMIAVQTFDTGLESWENLENIYSVPVRNRIICRFDMVNLLREYFEERHIEKYREVLYFIATGNFKDAEMLSDLIQAFLKEDAVFRKSISKIFNNCPLDKSFGEYIAIEFATVMLTYQRELTDLLVGRGEFVICNSDGYLYLSFPDVSGHKLDFPYSEQFKELYNGKNWRSQS